MQMFQARQALIKKQAELQERLDAINVSCRSPHSHDWSEQAQERENDEVLDALAIETATELKQVRNALAKIGNHQYGLCQCCGGSISEQRLDALPQADTCISCAQNEEAKRA